MPVVRPNTARWPAPARTLQPPNTASPSAGSAVPAPTLERSLIGPAAPMRTVIEHLNDNDTQICLVVDDRRVLLGTVTDGDVRRAILRGLNTHAPASEIMFRRPRVLQFGRSRDDALAYLRSNGLKHLPVVDFAGRAIDLITLDGLLAPQTRDNWVVVFAGGQGMRLRPLTESTPKPMLDVGGRPILETILRRCAAAGFTKFFLSVNYQADIIKRYFGDGQALGLTIRYLEEDAPLGTAGSLGLLPQTDDKPVVVMNGDILTKADPGFLIAYHEENQAAATMAVREYEVQVPYGVVDLHANNIQHIREKPVERYFINAGIYVLGRAALSQLSAGAAMDMPDLFDRLRNRGHKTLAYPIREYWVDIGHLDDYQRANSEFSETFL